MASPLFSTYRQGENRITASILAVFERLSFGLVERLIQALCQEPEAALLTFSNQPAGQSAVPDGRIRASFSYWIETKRVPNAIRPDQIRRHLKELDAETKVERQRLLVLTPDASLPPVLAEIKDSRVAWASFEDLMTVIGEITEPGPEWLSSDRPLPTEQERVLLREIVRLLLAEGLVGKSGDQVLVVAAGSALPVYRKYAAYICQPYRTFRPTTRLAFYANGVIDRHIPVIMEKHEAVTLSEDAVRVQRDLEESHRGKLLALVAQLDREKWDRPVGTNKVIFLSGHDDPATLVLPQDIKNDLVADSGRPVAFTQSQRYVSLARLEKCPTTTSELLGNERI